MKKQTLIIVLCCVVPLVVIGFIFFYRGGSTNRSSSANQPGNQRVNSANNAFPEFSVTDIDGQTISNGTLKGKPAIIWFTATWCTPCQIGAEAVAKLQDELGAQSFNVLVIFVDPKEQPSDLRRWREQFARPAWRLAMNNGLAASSKIQFLDSKYLLNRDGTIRDFDTQISSDQYLKLIRSTVSQ